MFQCKSTIIAHRGWWLEPTEKNTVTAFIKALEAGFGIETDIRDLNGTLVIAHDMPTLEQQPLTVAQFFELYNQYATQHAIPPMLALNIKCDGLAKPLAQLLKHYNIHRYFVFDMSIPDTLQYIREGFTTFTRWSDIEPEPLLVNDCAGIWIDAFYSDWLTFPLKLPEPIQTNKTFCFVSSELHRRNQYQQTWLQWKTALNNHPTISTEHLFLCTDFPMEAFTFFND